MAALSFSVYNRIHINSIFMSAEDPLLSGGVGFPVDIYPTTINIQFKKGSKNIFNGYKGERIEEIIHFLSLYYSFSPMGWEVEVKPKLRPHIGLGSTTQIEAGIVDAILQITQNKRADLEDFNKCLIGLESGIGIKCYLKKGFLVDFGYWKSPENLQKKTVKNSLRFKLPESWTLLLIIPREYKSISGNKEDEFWKTILPVKKEDPLFISYSIIEMIASILDEKFTNFIDSLNRMTSYGTKPFEIELNNLLINKVYKEIVKVFGFCGLSSLGPTCYTFINMIDCPDYKEKTAQLAKNFSDFEFVFSKIVYD